MELTFQLYLHSSSCPLYDLRGNFLTGTLESLKTEKQFMNVMALSKNCTKLPKVYRKRFFFNLENSCKLHRETHVVRIF